MVDKCHHKKNLEDPKKFMFKFPGKPRKRMFLATLCWEGDERVQGFSYNGLSYNLLSYNGLSYNGLS